MQNSTKLVACCDGKERAVVRGTDQLLDVVLGEAELRDDERWRLVQLHNAVERELGVLGGHRLAGIELRVATQVEGECQAVAADLELLGQVADDGLTGLRIRHHQLAVDVAVELVVGELVGLGGIHRDHVVDGLAHDQHVLRRGGLGADSSGAAAEVASSERRVSMVCFPSIRFGLGQQS
jgi:hypothetical protein